MEKFNIKKMYGYYWMIISLIVQFTIFIFFLGLILYLKSVLTCVDILIALFCVGKLASYLYLLLPFKNTNGKIVTIKITERNIFATMHGIIETEKGNDEVKVIFMSGGFKFFSDFNVGDYVDCFIREKDLSNPKFVVLYR